MLPRSCLVKLTLSIQQAELFLFHFFNMQIIFLSICLKQSPDISLVVLLSLLLKCLKLLTVVKSIAYL